ncbi:MAG: MFS transporter [Pseudomonadota bacterium]
MATKKRKIWGWMFFDWANQPFHTLILTFIFGPYFISAVAADPVEGQATWSFVTTIGAISIALLAPIFGAIADASGPRRPWIALFSLLYVIGVAGLWNAVPGMEDYTFVLICFVLAMIGAEFSTVFVNSLLPLLGNRDEIGRISGSSWAFGYWGGLVSLVLVLGFMAPFPGNPTTILGMEPVFGLDPAMREGDRATGPLSAIWFLVFIIPFALWAPDTPRVAKTTGAVAKGFRELWRTIVTLPKQRELFAYLMSSMFYRDALNGLFLFGGGYAAGVLGWETFQLGVFGIIAAFLGAIGAWIGGISDSRFGPKPVINFCIVALIIVSCVTISTGPGEVFFMDVGADSGLPTLVFYICGGVIGAAGGSLQSASRTMLVRQADPAKMTEAFGIYALAGKATAFLAPLLIGIATVVSESQRIGVTPVIALFVIGLVLMAWVSREGRAVNA